MPIGVPTQQGQPLLPVQCEARQRIQQANPSVRSRATAVTLVPLWGNALVVGVWGERNPPSDPSGFPTKYRELRRTYNPPPWQGWRCIAHL